MSDEAVPDALVVRPVHWTRPWIIGLLYWLILIPLTIPPRHNGNVWSRYLTAESLVERGTLAIERSPLLQISGSPDVIKVDRHLYSDKPPVLSALAALLYLPAAIAGVRFSGSPDQFIRVNLLLVSGIVGVCSALTLVWLRQLLQFVPLSRLVADLLTLGFGFGSLLLTYGVTFNNHSVAAGLLTGGARYGRSRTRPSPSQATVRGRSSGRGHRGRRPSRGWCLARGTGDLADDSVAWCTLVVSCRMFRSAVATRRPADVGDGLTLAGGDDPRGFSLRRFVLDDRGGTLGGNRPPLAIWAGASVRAQGWLTVTPVLAFGLIELIRTLRNPHDPLRPLSAVVSATVVVLLTYYIWAVRRTDFAGQSFGVRHLLPITPACYLFSCVALGRWRNRFANVAFTLLLGIGMVFALAGMLDPWSRVERRNDVAIVAVRWLALYPWSSYDR